MAGTRGQVSAMRWTSDMMIGAGLTLALLLTVILPACGVVADYGKLQDTLAIGLVGFMGKAVIPTRTDGGERKDKKEEHQ